MSGEKKKNTTVDEVEETLACAAFAEEGEACPGCGSKATAAPAHEAGESLVEEIEDELADVAFAEQNEPCPICKGKSR